MIGYVTEGYSKKKEMLPKPSFIDLGKLKNIF